jgi:hypothetical protein
LPEEGVYMKASGIFSLLLVVSVFLFPAIKDRGGSGHIVSGVAYAEVDWKSEYEDICGKTQDAMVYSSEELRHLIDRCDKIRPLVEKLEQTQRKVYLRRLQMCRDLFAFALDSKEKK